MGDRVRIMDIADELGLKEELAEAKLLVIPMKKAERRSFYKERINELLQYTAIFAVSDYYAIDMLQFLSEAGIRVPEQISVAGFDDSMLSRQIEPSLTTIGQDHERRARLALVIFNKNELLFLYRVTRSTFVNREKGKVTGEIRLFSNGRCRSSGSYSNCADGGSSTA